MTYLNEQNLWILGAWLARRFRVALQKLGKAQGFLDRCTVPLKTLEIEWAAQIKHQTEPLPCEFKLN